LCPTACPTRPEFPMVKPNQPGIIIRVSGVRVPPPASRKARNPGDVRLPRQLRLRRHRGAPRRLRRADDRGGRSTRRRPALPRRGGPPLARHATTPRWPSQSHAPRRREPGAPSTTSSARAARHRRSTTAAMISRGPARSPGGRARAPHARAVELISTSRRIVSTDVEHRALASSAASQRRPASLT